MLHGKSWPSGSRLSMLTAMNFPALRFGLAALLFLAAALLPSRAAQVAFTRVIATYDQGAPYVIGSTIDGVTTGTGGGWGIFGQRFAAQAAFWKPAAPLNGSTLEVRLIQNFGSEHWINEFRLSWTTDAEPDLSGTWTPWLPATRLSSGTTLTVVSTDHIRSEGAPATVTYTLRGGFPVQGITGLRLEVFPFDYNAADGLAASLGRAPNGNFVLSEFQAETDPEINIALNRPITASGALWPGFAVTNVVDGSTGTIAHPLADTGTLGFTYEVDLGATWSLSRIAIRNRADGCCPERLTNYQVQVYGEDSENGGELGDLNWSAIIRGDGSNSGNGGTDTVLAAADATPGHTFTGRYLRVINLSNAAYNPQLSEIEAYGSLLPGVISFTASDDTISAGQSTTLSWQTVNADTVTLTPAPGAVGVTGNASVSPAATTSYTLTATNAAGSVSRTLNIGVDVTLLPPELSEFQAAGSTRNDEDNTPQDWIELHNPNPYWLDLDGCRLTDVAANASLWTFPAGTRIPPGGFLVVFASGKNRANPGANLHTNFSLDAGGEYLALLSPAGVILREFSPAFPAQFSGISYGFGPGGTAGYFKPPTPGAANGAAFEGLVDDTAFSVDRGFYEAPLDVAITCATPGTTIRYTLDGSAPSEGAGSIYSAPVRITGTTTLRAAAFRAGWAPSNVDTHTYLFPAQVIAQPAAPAGFPATWAGTPADYEMDPDVTTSPAYAGEMQQALKSIRTLSIVLPPEDLFGAARGIYTFPENRGLAWERACSAELILPPGWVEQNGGVPPPPAGLNGGTGFQENCGLRIWGYGWRPHSATKKHSFRLKFKDIYDGPGKLAYPLFPGWDVQKFDNIVLRSQGSRGWNDFRTPDISQSQYIHDSFARDTAAEMGKLDGPATVVHLYLNGLYWGLYNAVLRPDASFGEEHYGGTGADYDALNARFSIEVIDGDRIAWDAALALGDAGLADNARYQQLQQYVDLDNLIDYALYNCWATNHDGPGSNNNFRALRKREPGGQFRFYFWDMEYTLWSETENAIASWLTTGDNVWALFSQLRQNPEFRLRFADRVQRHCFNGGALTASRAVARWNARATEIHSAILGESARWGDARRATPFTRDVEWEAERIRLTGTYFPNRNANMIPHLQAQSLFPAVAAPVLSQHGGSVSMNYPLTMAGPGGAAIFYTLNGTDPREAITGNAIGTLYSGTVLMQNAGRTVVRARSLSGGVWSALTEADFSIALVPASSANLVISELHYNPLPGGAEFIELLNISSGTIDLSGCAFSQGITYTFPVPTLLNAGQRLVLGESSWVGGLSNGGERLTLMAADGSTVIRSFAWGDIAPWPVGADGAGPSLVLIAPMTNPDHSLPENWRSSMAPGGNPGTDDAVRFTGNPAADTDADGFPDFAEYALGENPQITHAITPDGLTMTIPRVPNADDALIAGEVSTTLSSWTAAELIAVSSTSLTYRVPAAMTAERRVFLRASIEHR